MKVLIPTPSSDFDPSETSIPWKELKTAGHTVIFSTPDARPGKADPRMLTGEGLGLFKGSLIARQDGIERYYEMASSTEFQNPLSYSALKEQDFDALLLPGGHAPGMKPYLESTLLQSLIVDFFQKQKIVAAICHGTLLAARSIDPAKGKSVLWDKKTTGLLRSQELFAWRLTKHKLGSYYRTYPTPLEDEVRSLLKNPEQQFLKGPALLFLGIPLDRDSSIAPHKGFIVQDGRYLSARWPGDAYRFSQALVAMLGIN